MRMVIAPLRKITNVLIKPESKAKRKFEKLIYRITNGHPEFSRRELQ